VALAKLALQGANFLVLDEPTNHLDIPSQEILQAVLGDYPGTILLVSHDRYFIDALATQVWALEEGTVYVSRAEAPLSAYPAYLLDRQARQAARSEAAAPSRERPGDGDVRREAERKREQARRQRDLAELEAAIAAAEARLAALSAGLEEASHAQAFERLETLGRDYKTVEEELARLLDQWTAMEAV
jgi:ATP-binding cassette subfamily F protein 3